MIVAPWVCEAKVNLTDQKRYKGDSWLNPELDQESARGGYVVLKTYWTKEIIHRLGVGLKVHN